MGDLSAEEQDAFENADHREVHRLELTGAHQERPGRNATERDGEQTVTCTALVRAEA